MLAIADAVRRAAQKRLTGREEELGETPEGGAGLVGRPAARPPWKSIIWRLPAGNRGGLPAGPDGRRVGHECGEHPRVEVFGPSDAELVVLDRRRARLDAAGQPGDGPEVGSASFRR
ncbi:hypothetical protein OHA91_35765 [Streptomyces erythrochromogenes]|uniref:Uncharacterized protein n=1 Tax=Streptomyces erythrochromogenes TaxID=285574 RepID=A0ABZ1QLE3_9ACTN